jgi:acyl dehydratase
VQPYSLIAFNTATSSTNRIHDDAVAREYGFQGGLVPGVNVYAYLTHPPVRFWGREWLERGTMQARFLRPVYDGHRVLVAPTGDGRLEARDEAGVVCATAIAAVHNGFAVIPDPKRWPEAAQATDPPVAAPEVLEPGTAFGLAPHRFHADKAGEYLADIRERSPIYADEGIAHPAWVLRDANYVLSANVQLGPWIHVESIVRHLGVVKDGDEVSARAIVTAEWEHKGHRFVTLDVLHLAGERSVARTEHTAIYRPRGA